MHRYLLAIAAGAMACGRYPAGQATVTIAVSGPGAVRTSNLNGDCRATCWFSVDREVPVHLEPIPGSQAVFAGWTGGCHGTGTCDLKPALDVSVAATFMPATPRRLQVSLNGAGEVRSDPPGIDCPQSCAANFPEGTSVTLYPSAAAGWGFTGFGGACAGPACTITLAADAAAVATFILNPVELALQVTGGGSVVSTPAAIDCPGVCSAIFAPGTAVTLTASATVGSTFAGFSGGCTGPSCSLRLTAPASVSAAFALIPTFKVTVVTAGNGVGRVTSSPAGIDCPGTCGTIFPVDTAVTLSAAADALSKFAGFDGTCSGAACTLRVAADAAVVAKFDPRRYAARDLSVPGGGWWTAPTGISRTGTLVADPAPHSVLFLLRVLARLRGRGCRRPRKPAHRTYHPRRPAPRGTARSPWRRRHRAAARPLRRAASQGRRRPRSLRFRREHAAPSRPHPAVTRDCAAGAGGPSTPARPRASQRRRWRSHGRPPPTTGQPA